MSHTLCVVDARTSLMPLGLEGVYVPSRGLVDREQIRVVRVRLIQPVANDESCARSGVTQTSEKHQIEGRPQSNVRVFDGAVGRLKQSLNDQRFGQEVLTPISAQSRRGTARRSQLDEFGTLDVTSTNRSLW